jgi:hypothetical protein
MSPSSCFFPRAPRAAEEQRHGQDDLQVAVGPALPAVTQPAQPQLASFGGQVELAAQQVQVAQMDVQGHQATDVIEGTQTLGGLGSGRGRLGVPPGEGEGQAQVGVTEGAGPYLALRLRHGHAQLQVGDRRAELAAQRGEYPSGQQQPAPFGRRGFEPEQDLSQPVRAFLEQAGDLPVGTQVSR